jgi:hypothetical protein
MLTIGFYFLRASPNSSVDCEMNLLRATILHVSLCSIFLEVSGSTLCMALLFSKGAQSLWWIQGSPPAFPC